MSMQTLTSQSIKTRTIAALSGLMMVSSISVSLPAQAGMVTNSVIAQQSQLEDRRAQMLQALNRDDVRQQMLALKVKPADVENRIASMTPQELAQLEQRLADLPAGSGVLGTVVLVLVIFILLDIAGVTDIFPGV